MGKFSGSLWGEARSGVTEFARRKGGYSSRRTPTNLELWAIEPSEEPPRECPWRSSRGYRLWKMGGLLTPTGSEGYGYFIIGGRVDSFLRCATTNYRGLSFRDSLSIFSFPHLSYTPAPHFMRLLDLALLQPCHLRCNRRSIYVHSPFQFLV